MHSYDAHSTLIKAWFSQQIVIRKYWEISHLQMRQESERNLTQKSRAGPTSPSRDPDTVSTAGRELQRPPQATVMAMLYSGDIPFQQSTRPRRALGRLGN